MLCVYLAFIAQYSNILLKIFSLVSLFDSHTEKKNFDFCKYKWKTRHALQKSIE